MSIGWSSLKNKLFKRYLNIRNYIHGAVHFRFCCRFEICNLIASSASSLRFQDSPIHLDRTWSCLSCPEALQIWPPSELTFLERDLGLTSDTSWRRTECNAVRLRQVSFTTEKTLQYKAQNITIIAPFILAGTRWWRIMSARTGCTEVCKYIFWQAGGTIQFKFLYSAFHYTNRWKAALQKILVSILKISTLYLVVA